MKLGNCALALLVPLTASAHHSLALTVDLRREITLEGTVTGMLLRNPHSFLQIEVSDQNGRTERWSLEFPKGANSLRKQAIEVGTLKVGDHLSVTIHPPLKPGTAVGSITSLRRASDGFEWVEKIKRKRS